MNARHLSVLAGWLALTVPAWAWDPIGDITNPGRILRNIEREARSAGRAIDRARLEANAQTGAPVLAAWIRESRNDVVRAGTRAIPDSIYRRLKTYFPDSVLRSVSYRVGEGHFLSLASSSFNLADAQAITLEDVVVFRHRDDAEHNHVLWAHELAHVQQYQRWGLHDFAIRYLRSWNSVENEAYEVQRRYETHIASLSPRERGEFDRIRLKNECSYPVIAALRWRDLDDRWVTRGWWELEPGETAYVADTRNRIYYTHVRTRRGEILWDDNDYTGRVRNSDGEYGFRRQEITTNRWGNWTQGFACKTSEKRYFVYFENKCHEEVWLAVNIKRPDGDWAVDGWWQIPPGEKVFVGRTRNRVYYYHAERDGGVWSGDDLMRTVNGGDVTHGFRRKRIDRDSWGPWTQGLTCR